MFKVKKVFVDTRTKLKEGKARARAKATTKFVGALGALSTVGILSVPSVSVFASDPFESTKGLASGTTTKVQMIAAAVFALVLAVTGLIYGFGGRDLKAKMKSKWVDIALGIVVVFAAVGLVAWGVSWVQQNGFGN